MKISYIFKAWPDADVLIESSKEELALLIFLYENGAQDAEALCDALALRPARAQGALAMLEDAGLIQRAEDGVAVEFSPRAAETFASRGGKTVAKTISFCGAAFIVSSKSLSSFWSCLIYSSAFPK